MSHGLCECGCGRKTTLAPHNNASKGWVKGEPLRFVRGHSSRRRGPEWVREDRGYNTSCWIWQGWIQATGHGRKWNGERVEEAHRVYYRDFVGPISEGKEIHHLCGQPACVNPDHLEALTRRAHMLREGRLAYGRWEVAA